MITTCVLLLGVMGWDGTAAVSAPPDRQAYEAERAKAGRDAESQVQLALWCEQHGMPVERAEHLAKALLADPAHVAARALFGQVRDGGRWLKADELAAKIADDNQRAAALAEYNRKRAETDPTAAAQAALATWCEANGLQAEAIAHWTVVVRLDPSREVAWRKLGCKKYQGRWMTDAAIAAIEAERRAQDRANRAWMPRLTRIAEQLRKERGRAQAEHSLDSITDPRVVPSLWRVFIDNGEAGQIAALRVLGHLDSVAASQTLAALTVRGASAEVRRQAGENLRQRDRREYLDLLIMQVRKPLKYELRPNPETNAVELYVEGVAYDLQRTYRYPTVNGDPRAFFDPYFSASPVGQSRINSALMQRAANASPAADPAVMAAVEQFAANPQEGQAILQAAQRNPIPQGFVPAPLGGGFGNSFAAQADSRSPGSLERMLQANENRVARNLANLQAAVEATESRIQRDCQEIERINAGYAEQNGRVLPVLGDLTTQDLGSDPEAWTRWWTDEQGYAYRSSPKPVVYEVVREQTLVSAASCSCFAAGTPVHTRAGLKAIETVMVGDQVLSQDVVTGELRYEPVVAAWHNRPDQTYQVRIDGETIVATGIHRFWKAREGWTMVRDLRPGDQVRTRSGVGTVDSVDKASVAPVFNLELPKGRSFFVGRSGALVHDYSLIETVDQPFDRIVVTSAKDAPR